MDDRAERRYEAACERIAELGSVLVAYSGGVDSTVLAVAAQATLGARALAVIARSDTYPESEAAAATALAAELGLNMITIDTHELADPRFTDNPPDRCYYCKRELFGLLRTVADARGFAAVADGSNADDASDHRPGRRAAIESGVVSPLAEAGMTKADIRHVARMLGLPNHDKPSMACLASRFPYGARIDDESLRRVATAEQGLAGLGLRQFRVRSHGDVARIEIDPAELDGAWLMRGEIAAVVRSAGFPYVAADLDGYRTGALNETLTRTETATG